MKKILCFLALLSALNTQAQSVEIAIGGSWVEILAQQTQSELKPGWKIVDYQMKSRLTHYLYGGHATQLADGNMPTFRVTPGSEEVLVDYALILLKHHKDYRKLPKAKLMDNLYTRLEPKDFDIRAYDDSFICKPRQPLSPGDYILVCLSQKPIGELGDILVYPFYVIKE